MIVYRELGRSADPRRLLDECRRLAAAGEAADLLVAFGEFEAAVADALFPARDDLHPLAEAMRETALAIARAYRGEQVALAGPLDRLARLPLPARVTVKPAEGYAFYGLMPETYLQAAAAFARDRPPGRALCIGLRSIGASLSALVAAELGARGWRIDSFTLRPRGHPFDRRPALAPALRRRLAQFPQAWRLVVDEGPGLSGSSLTGVAAALDAPPGRVALFPSWLPDASRLLSPAARARWPLHPKAHAEFRPARFGPGARDLSAGAWRRLAGRWPAVQPEHERRKHLTPDGRLFKFAGLGARGRAAFARAQALAAAGFAPPALAFRGGFLEQAFLPAAAARARSLDRALFARAADYLAWRAAQFGCDEAADPEPLAAMLEANLGAAPPLPPPARAVLLDNRLAPHEWLRAATGWLKADGVDHADDHFYPGPHDIAWDVAGFAAEFRLSRAAARDFAEAVAARIRDPRLPDRLPFYRIAYLGARLGYAELARERLAASPDGRRFARRARALGRALAAEPAPTGRRL